MSENTLKLIQENNVKWVDLRFTDTRGKEQHVTNHVDSIDEEFFENGAMFDGSSIAGWKPINESDMILRPDDSTAVMDPFVEDPTLILRCDIVEPSTLQGYERDPRSLAKRAEAFLASTGVGDTAFFGPEPEFFVFDDVKFGASMGGAMYSIRAEEAAWASDADFEGGNLGHRPRVKGGYFPVPPVDSALDLRNAMCSAMESMGLTVELHHHEVGTACQAEIGTRFASLTRKADETQIYKYCVLNVADAYGKTATAIFPRKRSGISVASSSMHVRSMHSRIRARTPTSAWYRDLRHRCFSSTPHVTDLRAFVSPTSRAVARRASAWKFASVILPPTRT